MNKTFRIAHISDIHFRAGFPLHQWEHVKHILRLHQPQAIIITGDFVESPWPLMLVLARREILELERDLGVPVVTIPGNHDVAFKGSFPLWPLTRLYWAVFSQKMDAWVLTFPTFQAFYTMGFACRLLFRLWLYMRIAWRWMTFRLRRGEPQDELVIPKNVALRIVGFDSNQSLFLASGRVSAAQIYKFGSHVNQFDTAAHIADALLPRVAMIHHHLIPIPYTRRDVAGNESFLVLRNAGTMLRELWSHDFDLVLHGHRHYSSFARIAFDQTSQSGRELAVLSAASPTTKEPEAGTNSFHLVDFFANGRIRTRKIAFGSEMTAQDPARSADQWFDALSIHAVKVRNFRRTVNLMNHSCDEFEREVSLNHVGAATERIRYRGLTVRAGGGLDARHFRARVDRGSISNNVFEELREDGLWSPGCYLHTPAQEASDSREAQATVRFQPALVEGKKVSFGIQYKILNSFAMSNWELRTFPSASDPAQGPVGVTQRSLRNAGCVSRTADTDSTAATGLPAESATVRLMPCALELSRSRSQGR